MSNPTTTTLGPQINYKTVENRADPSYRFLRLNMSNKTGSKIEIQPGSSDMIEFILPSGTVYNLSESYISYQVNVTAQTHYTFLHEDCLDIGQNVFFGPAGGSDLCNLSYINKFTKIVTKMKTPINEFLSRDNKSQLYPCNSLNTANIYPVTGIASSRGTTSYIEPQYLQVSADATAIAGNRFYKLSNIKDTIFSVNKDLYFGNTDMYLRLSTANGNAITWWDATAATPASANGALANDITISSIFLHLAVETNDLIKESVINKVMTVGLPLQIPYTQAFRNPSTTASANIQLNLTRQYGSKLKSIVHTVWNTSQTSGATVNDCHNFNGAKIQDYNTFLDNRQLQDSKVSCLIATVPIPDDWKENQKHCVGSCILNNKVYQLNWFHCDKFTEKNHLISLPDENVDDGLPMNTSRLYQFQSTTAGNALEHITFVTFSRPITIKQNGIEFNY